MELKYLVEDLEMLYSNGIDDREISAVCYDSRKEIPAGGMFICISGAVSDGHTFANAAVTAGAVAIVAEHRLELPDGVAQIVVKDTRQALSLISAAWFGYPARELKTVALTGTKGKSTTTYMIKNILTEAGHKVGVIGTIGVAIGEEVYPTNNTTPESYLIQQYFREMADKGCDTVVMEVSSQGLKQSRVYGIEFDYAAFTNLEPDHIGKNEHASFEEYAQCKSMLFKQCKVAIMNKDDAHASYMLDGSEAAAEYFGMLQDGKCTACGKCVFASDINLLVKNGNYGIAYKCTGGISLDVELSIPGSFNIYNSLCAIAVCSHFTSDTDAIARGLYNTAVRGRLEPVNISSEYGLLIDYAHNAMALKSLLETLKEYQPKRLVCLFGCGGNRSRDRRFEMGEVSSQLADLTVVTSDNPRFEKPEDIIADILVGVQRENGEYTVIPDRREAIKFCIDNARPGDLIVLAGKGNEDYQEICGQKYHMDEREIIADIVGGKA